MSELNLLFDVIEAVDFRKNDQCFLQIGLYAFALLKVEFRVNELTISAIIIGI